MKNSELFTILCDCLAFSDENDRLSSTLSMTDFPWEGFIESASQHLVTPALHNTLKEKGVLESIPRDVADYLEATLILNRTRNEELQCDLLKIGEQFNIHGITPVALKGAASLVEELYPDNGMRVLSDLDIVIPKQRLDECVKILHGLGFQTQTDFEDEFTGICHHYYPLVKKDGITVVELHLEVVHDGYQEMLPLQLLEENCQVIDWQGARIATLSPTLRVLHNILHTHLADSNFRFKQVSLRQLYELGMIVRKESTAIDWDWILSQFETNDSLPALENYLLLGSSLLNMDLPGNINTRITQTKARDRLLWQIDHPGVSGIRRTLSHVGENLLNALRTPAKLKRLLNPQWFAYKLKKLGSFWTK
ncbi:MAG: nucleotidyltransferase family protein [Candidatus Sedimenticola sp. 20ELBAFRAG]